MEHVYFEQCVRKFHLSNELNLFTFFLSLADQVFGDEEMHATVRQNCMDYIVSLIYLKKKFM